MLVLRKIFCVEQMQRHVVLVLKSVMTSLQLAVELAAALSTGHFGLLSRFDVRSAEAN